MAQEKVDLSTMVFRLANLEDYQSVMDINTDIYFGLDYLPSFYHQHIQDPRRMYMLAEIDSKVVSFIGVFLLPGDRTVVYESGRTHPDYQGLGIYKKLKAAIRKKMQEKWPTVSSALSNTPNADTSFIRNSARPGSPSRILQKGYCNFFLVPRDLITRLSRSKEADLLPECQSGEKIAILDDEKAVLGCLNDPAIRKVLPGEFFNIYWNPYPVSTAGMAYVVKEIQPYVVASMRIGGDSNDGGEESANQIVSCHSSVSFGSVCKVKIGTAYCFDFYGKSTSDCLRHFRHHIGIVDRYLPATYSENVCFLVMTSSDVNRDIVCNYIRDKLGMQPFSRKSGLPSHLVEIQLDGIAASK